MQIPRFARAFQILRAKADRPSEQGSKNRPFSAAGEGSTSLSTPVLQEPCQDFRASDEGDWEPLTLKERIFIYGSLTVGTLFYGTIVWWFL